MFIPNERIFLKGEWEFAGDVAYMFANFHRLSAETYKAMELELFTGAATLMAEYNGIEKKAHVREKLTWLVMYTEAVETLGKAAVEHCVSEEGRDFVYPNPMIANICKFYFADNWHQATKYIQDIGGGIVVTAPSYKDFTNPETHDFMEKYFAGSARTSTEKRLRMVKLVRDLTSCYEDVLTIHAEGSLEAQKMSILQLADWAGTRRRRCARRAPRREEAPDLHRTAAVPAGALAAGRQVYRPKEGLAGDGAYRRQHRGVRSDGTGPQGDAARAAADLVHQAVASGAGLSANGRRNRCWRHTASQCRPARSRLVRLRRWPRRKGSAASWP